MPCCHRRTPVVLGGFGGERGGPPLICRFGDRSAPASLGTSGGQSIHTQNRLNIPYLRWVRCPQRSHTSSTRRRSAERSRNGGDMRHSWLIAVALALALGLLGGGVSGAEGPAPGSKKAPAPRGEEASLSSVSECSSGNACVWPGTGYTGTVGQSLCTGGLHSFGGNVKTSGANFCIGSLKAVWFRNSGATVECLNPNGIELAFPKKVNELWVGAEGSHC